MFEYQFSVAQLGRFTFRTEWMEEYEMQHTAKVLQEKFPASEGWSVCRNTRSATYTSENITV